MWKIGIRANVLDLSEIAFLGQFVNCIIPAKLGDIYRERAAYTLGGLRWVIGLHNTSALVGTKDPIIEPIFKKFFEVRDKLFDYIF